MSTSGSRLRIDVTGLRGGVELDVSAAAAAYAAAKARHSSGDVGFWDLPDNLDSAAAAMKFAASVSDDIDTVVVLGIGGSSLGGQAIYQALAPMFDALRSRSPGMPRRLFFPDNSDPETLDALLSVTELSRTLFIAITKSGGTAETAAALMIVCKRLEALGADALSRHVVVITDPDRGALRDIANAAKLTTFPVPASVGGRFSALCAVGLVPAALAGLDVRGLLDGARSMRDRVLGDGCDDVHKNPALLIAALLAAHDRDHGRQIVVMMPYADRLGRFADWFRQLWAESLGKDGRGPTPLSARGATDQHSLLQLFAGGPDDKVYCLVGIDKPARSQPIEHADALGDAFDYLAGRSLGELIAAQRRGTLASLSQLSRPCMTIDISRLDAFAFGQLLMLWMAATAFAGPLYGVDAYDQPGVEQAKRLASGALGRAGFEAESEALASAISSDDSYVF